MSEEYRKVVDSDLGLQKFIDEMDRKWSRKYKKHHAWGRAVAKRRTVDLDLVQ